MVRLTITSGDPAGIGSEVTLKAISELELPPEVAIVVLGSRKLYNQIAEKLGSSFSPEEIANLEETKEGLNFLNIEPSDFSLDILGKPTDDTARATFNYLKKSVELLKNGFDGVVTAPISKEKLWNIGFKYPGHTEFYADNLNCKEFVMMLGGDKLKVSLVTIHIPLREVPSKITAEEVEKTIRVTDMEFRRSFGYSSPRIAVAGLNPHAGEGGKLGTEEKEIIEPVVKKLAQKGLSVRGPFPPDTLFYRAYKGEFDVVVSMYHDQGLIPLKLLHFDDAINVTLGLPKVRTSVDHGTAYDIAPLLKANHISMKNAILTAISMVENRRKYEVHKDQRGKGT